MTTRRRFVLVDVFADRPLAGNPLAVFPDAQGLDAPAMQSIAREMDHAATAFLFPASDPAAAFRLRIFSRDREIPFAGHPALGAHFVHASENDAGSHARLQRIAHEAEDGRLLQVEIARDGKRIVMLRLAQRPPVSGEPFDDESVVRVALALGLSEEHIQAANQPVQVVSTGLPSLIVPVATLADLHRASPRYEAVRQALEGREASVVYAFTKETIAAPSAAHARAFDVAGSVEVPGAGAAAGALAAYLVSNAAVTVLPVTALVIEQGHVLNRPSTLYAEVHVQNMAVTKVLVGGRVVRVGEGAIEV